jgi:hypothetical protein
MVLFNNIPVLYSMDLLSCTISTLGSIELFTYVLVKIHTFGNEAIVVLTLTTHVAYQCLYIRVDFFDFFSFVT